MYFILLVFLWHLTVINADTDQIVIRKVEELAVRDNHDNTILLQYHASIEVNSMITQSVNYTKADDKSILWKLITQNGFLESDSNDNEIRVPQLSQQRKPSVRGKRQAIPVDSTTTPPYLTTTTVRNANNGSQFWDGVKEGAKKVRKFVKEVGKQVRKTFKDVFGGNDSNGGSNQNKD